MAKFTLLCAALLVSLTTAVPFTPPASLSVRQTSETENDLVDGSPCKALTLIFARGTTESGNMGSIVGPPFAGALVDSLGDSQVAVQGVDYAASIAGFLEGGDPAGTATLAGLISQAITQCPNTKILVSGYRYFSPTGPNLQMVLIKFIKQSRWPIGS